MSKLCGKVDRLKGSRAHCYFLSDSSVRKRDHWERLNAPGHSMSIRHTIALMITLIPSIPHDIGLAVCPAQLTLSAPYQYRDIHPTTSPGLRASRFHAPPAPISLTAHTGPHSPNPSEASGKDKERRYAGTPSPGHRLRVHGLLFTGSDQ